MNEEIDFAAFGLRPVGRSSTGGGLDVSPPQQRPAEVDGGGGSLVLSDGAPITELQRSSGTEHRTEYGSSMEAVTPHTASVAPARGSVSLASQQLSGDVLFWAFNLAPESVVALHQQLMFRQAMAVVQRRLAEHAHFLQANGGGRAPVVPQLGLGGGKVGNVFAFALRSAPYCSIPFAKFITDKHMAVFEHAAVRLVPRELLLFGDASSSSVDHLVVTFDCDDAAVSHLLSDNVPLFALLGTSGDLVSGYRTCKVAVQRLTDLRRRAAAPGAKATMPYGTSHLEKGVITWRCSKLPVQATLTKHVRGGE